MPSAHTLSWSTAALSWFTAWLAVVIVAGGLVMMIRRRMWFPPSTSTAPPRAVFYWGAAYLMFGIFLLVESVPMIAGTSVPLHLVLATLAFVPLAVAFTFGFHAVTIARRS